MACLTFPNTGLVPGVTTYVADNVTYLWDGTVWEAITAPLAARQITFDSTGNVKDKIDENTSVNKAQLIAQGYSGDYGFFEKGFAYVNVGDVGITADGEIWKYTGSGAPSKVVTAGTVPSVGAGYEQVTFNSASGVLDSRGTNVQDYIDGNLTPFKTVADMKAADFLSTLPEFTRVEWQGYYTQSDGGSNWGVLRFGTHTEDVGSIFSIDANTYIEANMKGPKVNVKKFGARGDGITDDTASLDAARGVGLHIVFPDGNYVVSGVYRMPYRVSGNFKITGNIKWETTKGPIQNGYIDVDGSILISGVWYSKFENLQCSGDFTLDCFNAVWGCYWNYMGFVRCAGVFTIDVTDENSINQNTFQNVLCGGVLIKGAASPTFGEAHNNTFISLDTTGANITASDGSDGYHVLNESEKNQTNTIINWYSETSGKRLIRGNWNVLGSNIDANNNPIMVDRNNSILFGRDIGRNGNYLAASLNIAEGGDWSKLNGIGLPLSMGGANISQVALSDAPDGNEYGAKQTGGSIFRAIDISFPLNSRERVCAVIFAKEEGSPADLVQVLGANDDLYMSGASSKTPLGNGWFLIRVSGTSQKRDSANGVTHGKIRLWTTVTDAGTISDARIISTFSVTNEDTALLPHLKAGPKTCYSSAPPTVGAWSNGDEFINTNWEGTAGEYKKVYFNGAWLTP